MSGVYIIHADGTDLYKIGRTRDFERRLREIATSSPHPVRLIATCDAEGRHLEPFLHKMLHRSRVHGEWFRFNSEEACIDEVTHAIRCLANPLLICEVSA